MPREYRGRSDSHRHSGPAPKFVYIGIIVVIVLMALLLFYRVKINPPKAPDKTNPAGATTPEKAPAKKPAVPTLGENLPSIPEGAPGAAGVPGEAEKPNEALQKILAPDKSMKDLPALLDRAKEMIAKKMYLYPDAPNNAVSVCKQILEVDPTNSFAKEQLAKMAESFYVLADPEIKNKRVEKAKENLEKSVAITPDNEKYQNLLMDVKKAMAAGSQDVG